MLNKNKLTKKIRRASQRPHKKKVFLYLSLALAGLVIFWWVFYSFYLPNHPSPNPSQYNNLDLSVAKKARYTNTSIRLIKDFGAQNNVRKQLVSFDVPKDDLSEYALMTLPTAQPAKGKTYPVIVLCHSYSAPQRYSTLYDYLQDMQFYSSHGYAVIKPDLRGNGFSIPNGIATSAYYSMDYNTDVMSLIAAIKATHYLDKKNISIWGHSMGGYIALRAAVLSKDIKNVILLAAPVGTPQERYADYSAISDVDNPIAAEVRDQELNAHGTPLSNPNFWNKTSPLNYLKSMKARVQINVGLKDTVIPPSFSAELNSELDKAKIEHQYFVYPQGTHSLIAPRPQIRQRSLEFLAR